MERDLLSVVKKMSNKGSVATREERFLSPALRQPDSYCFAEELESMYGMNT